MAAKTERLTVGEDGILTRLHGIEFQFLLVRYREGLSDPEALLVAPEARSVLLRLQSEDGAIESSVRLVPFPIDAVGEGGCRISMEVQSADRSMVRILGESFEAGESVAIRASSNSEILRFKEIASTNGTFEIVMFPHVRGKRGGATEVEAQGRKCSVTLHFHWGS